MTAFAEADLTRDGFLGGRILLWQPRDGYRAAIDPVLLAAFTPAVAGMRALDLGCGAGTAGLCLAARVPGLDLHGLEVQPAYAALARRNAAENDLPLVVHEGDLRRPPAALRAAAFDVALANPPFHARRTPAARDPGRDAAHREGEADVSEWIAAALRRLGPQGVLVMIHLPARLPAILAALTGAAGAVEVATVLPRADRAASRVLVRARKGARGPLALLPPLVLHGNGVAAHRNKYTEEAERVLRGEAALLLDTRLGGN